MTNDVLPLLFGGLDYAMDRLRERCAGLERDEYLWETVDDVWTVSESGGTWRAHHNARTPDPAPVPTIAWRLWHIGADCLASYAKSLGGWPLPTEPDEWFGEPAPALAAVDAAYGIFRERVTALGEAGIWRPLGPDWGPYADDSWAALAMHAMDEIAHHGAEVGLLRDLYVRLG